MSAPRGNVSNPVCTAEQASKLLEELRNSYQALTPKQQEHVKEFMCWSHRDHECNGMIQGDKERCHPEE